MNLDDAFFHLERARLALDQRTENRLVAVEAFRAARAALPQPWRDHEKVGRKLERAARLADGYPISATALAIEVDWALQEIERETRASAGKRAARRGG